MQNVNFIETAPYKGYLSTKMLEQAACLGVEFDTGMHIDYAGVDLEVE